jgi:hypothetical protein
MAYIPNRDDPMLSDPAMTPEQIQRNARLDDELQPDPELAEGPASGTRVALYAVAAVVILGAVFYGLNSSDTSDTTAQTTPTANTADSGTLPPPPGIRDVTPRSNTQPGMTTGAAPAQPAAPAQAPAAAPNGADSGANPSR